MLQFPWRIWGAVVVISLQNKFVRGRRTSPTGIRIRRSLRCNGDGGVPGLIRLAAEYIDPSASRTNRI